MKRSPKFTLAPWAPGKVGDSVVSPSSTVLQNMDTKEDLEYYGGALIAESIRNKADQRIIFNSPTLYERVSKLCDFLHERMTIGDTLLFWHWKESINLLNKIDSLPPDVTMQMDFEKQVDTDKIKMLCKYELANIKIPFPVPHFIHNIIATRIIKRVERKYEKFKAFRNRQNDRDFYKNFEWPKERTNVAFNTKTKEFFKINSAK